MPDQPVDAAEPLEVEATEDTASLGRLVPLPWEAWNGVAADEQPEGAPDGEEILELFLGWCSDRGIELWPHQEEALMSLMVGDHVILGTPTGSGKSLVALGMHFMAMCFGETSYYTAPIKALVSEKFFNLVELLGRDNVGMITGDVHINTEAPVICCTAEILANQALCEGPASKVGCVVMDEFHFYADPDRGWAQERKARDAAMAAMKADGVEYEERLERLAEVTYPKPLEELLDRAFELYCQGVPWARRLLRRAQRDPLGR